MKYWYHVLFVVVCGALLVFLLNAPEVTTPRLPANADHANRKEYQACPACHGAGSEAAMPEDHVGEAGAVRPDHAKCYFCHKPQED